MERIIFNVGNQVHVIIPMEGFDINGEVDHVPSDTPYEIVDTDNNVFPADRLFRDAWTWAGTGQPVVEDLERSRTIAFDLVKFVAGEAAIGAQRAEAILESTTYSTVQIRDAYAFARQYHQWCYCSGFENNCQ